MPSPVLICTDGSDLSLAAAGAALEILSSKGSVEILTVIDDLDPSLTVGTGVAGPTMTGEEYDRLRESAVVAANELLATAVARLGLADAKQKVLEGDAGPSICSYATDVSAAAIVLGSRGRGGLKRAVLGSVSDYVVRNAPCPTVITTTAAL